MHDVILFYIGKLLENYLELFARDNKEIPHTLKDEDASSYCLVLSEIITYRLLFERISFSRIIKTLLSSPSEIPGIVLIALAVTSPKDR